MSVDPLQYEYPSYSPYLYAGNKPINCIDLNGLEEEDKVELSPHVAENDNIVAPKVDLHEKIPTEPAGFDSGTGTEQNPIELPELEIVGEKKYDLEFGNPTYGTGLFQAIKMTAKHIGESMDLKEFGISLSGNNLVHGILTLIGDILDVFGFDILNKFRSSKEESQTVEETQVEEPKEKYVISTRIIDATIIDREVGKDRVFKNSTWVIYKSQEHEQAILRSDGTYNLKDTVDVFKEQTYNTLEKDTTYQKIKR